MAASPAACIAVSDSGQQRKVAVATEALAELDAQAAALREHLAKLRQDLVDVQRDLGAARANELREANEKLVLAVLKADGIAATAVSTLHEVTSAGQHDLLTGTPNRVLMRDRLDAAIAAARRTGSQLALLFLDLDDFKAINDALGHANGDTMLQLVAKRLVAAVRDSDTVSRQGGDEFLILLPQIAHAADAALIATKLLAAVAAPAPFDVLVLHLTSSLGIAIYPQDGTDAEVLTKRADTAMYHSKRHLHGSFEFYADCIAGERVTLPENHEWRPMPASHTTVASEHPDLRRANEQLVVSALSAQASAAQAIAAHSQQIRFMGLVAHELRNPLAPIRLAASMLTSGAQPPRNSLAKLSAVIETEVKHMARLIDDLLEGSRVSTGKLRLELGQVDLQEVVAQAAETCRPLIEAKQQQLALALPAGPVNLRGDHVRLRQIVSNLLDNASKYTGEGGAISLTMAVQEPTITITITDNGVGIAPEVLPSIFEMFVQDTRDRALSNGGLGIGLAVVRDLVRAHGGTVSASSAGKQCGSQFIVHLPLSGPAATTEA
jgi:diguanylate cyclase (GGDEF)-like protein